MGWVVLNTRILFGASNHSYILLVTGPVYDWKMKEEENCYYSSKSGKYKEKKIGMGKYKENFSIGKYPRQSCLSRFDHN